MGEENIFLSHLALFQDPKGLESDPPKLMPHRYQVILEVGFGGPNGESHHQYVSDRRQHADISIYTLKPEAFVLTELIEDNPPRQFTVDVFRGHFEKDHHNILSDITANVERVIYFKELDSEEKRPDQLEYLLFGRGKQLYLAHIIVAPPDFDHVLAVTSVDYEFSNEELAKGIHLVFPDTDNAVTSRLSSNKQVMALIQNEQNESSSEPVSVSIGKELFFEEGEFRLPPEFDTTEEEAKAGFP
ncbi:MAG: hypothetical protein MJA83_10570 [Gammaproteobacteria bacterium]|nr:hypothetical protein [Gammaproteobacteria bacterium]